MIGENLIALFSKKSRIDICRFLVPGRHSLLGLDPIPSYRLNSTMNIIIINFFTIISQEVPICPSISVQTYLGILNQFMEN